MPLLAAGVLTAIFAGCGQSAPTSSVAPKPVRASAGPLQQIQKQANRILDGGRPAFERRLAELRGYPLVVNQWASWCPPCRYEFPFFQRIAARNGDRIAFLGVDSADNRGDARKFLKKFPTPYPHYFDPDNKIDRVFHGGVAWPTTAFYSRSGELVYSHPGGYRRQADLMQDIRRYALNG